MKKFIYSLSLMLSAFAFAGCSDFFDPETDDMLPGEDYISSDTEMYTGFLGIMTNLQAIGDKEILLTDTRAELLETTTNSTPELIALYNYDENLQGNSYADPAPYYETIMACNDYLSKMEAYGKLTGVDLEMWADLVSCAIRVKVWVYKTIAEIYGEAVWFDTPVYELTELTPANGFELLSVEQVMERCLQLMKNGLYGVPSNREINFVAWLDPEHANSIAESKEYRPWNHMVPPYEGLLCELLLWNGAALDAVTPDGSASAPYYQEVCDVLLPLLDQKFFETKGNNPYWSCNTNIKGKWGDVFSKNNNDYIYMEIISMIIYDYTKNQTNTLNDHFLPSGYNHYLLAPSQVGMNRWSDKSFNPGGSQDVRYNRTFRYPDSAQPYIYKYSVASRSSYADVHVVTYRANMYHFFLVEALNHLKRYVQSAAVLNNGLNNIFDEEDSDWAGFTINWTKAAVDNKYYDMGIRGMFEIATRNIITDPSESDLSEIEIQKYNDLQMLDEALLEYACEGRTLPMMNRMALRYRDLNIVADRVCPKYELSGKDAIVRARILGGANYVHYDLKLGK